MAEASDQLIGLTLGEAFFRCVLHDPQVQSIAKKVVQQDETHSSVFDEGRYPGLYLEYIWPIDVTPSDLSYQFVRTGLIDLDRPKPKASPEIEKLCEVIADRLRGLRTLLSSGKLVARGTHAATGNVMSLDQFQWKRRGLLVDVQNSDVLDAQRHPPTLLWTGVALQAGPMTIKEPDKMLGPLAESDLTFHVKPTEHDQLRSSKTHPPKTRVTAEQQSIEAAIKALWPRGIPPGTPPKRIDDAIIKWQKEKERSITSTKSIRRYLSKHRLKPH
jgi:hypothetical protein